MRFFDALRAMNGDDPVRALRVARAYFDQEPKHKPKDKKK